MPDIEKLREKRAIAIDEERAALGELRDQLEATLQMVDNDISDGSVFSSWDSLRQAYSDYVLARKGRFAAFNRVYLFSSKDKTKDPS